MTFGNPWMLLGALAALIPVAVHLFDRRRPRPHPFAAIAFVLKSQRRTASRLKLKRLLLYTLRTLLLLAIPIALARPQLRKKSDAGQVAKGPAATALILDGSLAMRFKDGDALFERARDDARAALRDLGADEPATVLLCGDDAPVAAPNFDRGGLRSRIDELKPGFGVANLNACMDAAARALAESPVPGKRIELFSAFTAASLNLGAPPPTVAGPKGERLRPELVLHDAARDAKALPNRAITDLRIAPAPQVGPRTFQFTFTVRNHAPEPVKNLSASLEIGGQVVAKGFLDLPAQGSGQKTLTQRFDTGGPVQGTVRIASDGLTEDDARAFAVAVPRELQALVVDGEPSSTRYKDEAFFLDAALNAPGSPVHETVRDASSGLAEDLSKYDVVFLLNVAAPDDAEAARLAQFVEKGGGLFISVGDLVDPEAYNARLGKLLPRPLRLVKTAAAPDDPNADQKATRLAQISQDHPIFQPFVGQAREGLFSARVYRYMLLEGERPGEERSEVLATYEDGAPAVATARRGNGRVLLLTTTADHDWTDLPIRTSYLPLMHRFAGYLAGALEEHPEVRARVGQTVSLTPLPGQAPSRVKAPDGKDVPAQMQGKAFRVGPLPLPGPYAVEDANGKAIPALAFVATLDPSASDLTRLKPEELSAYFGEEAVRGPGGGAEHKVPLWTWLVVAAALAFFFEGTLLRRP